MPQDTMIQEAATGDVAALCSLWTQLRRLAFWIIRRYRGFYENNAAIDLDDLEQSAFLALAAAAKTYTPESGAFSSWYAYYVQSATATELGLRGRMRRELYSTIPMDTPLTDDGDMTIADTIADTSLPTEDELLEHVSMCDDLAAALARLPEDEAEAVRLTALRGQTMQEAADSMGVSIGDVINARRRAMTRLRRDRRLRMAYPDYMLHVGVVTFQNTGISAVERIVFDRMEIDSGLQMGV